LLSLFLVLTPLGDIKLVAPGAEPDYSCFTSFAFLFTAARGVGLVFYGVTAPVSHYSAHTTADAQTIGAEQEAMTNTLLHWGFHRWATYAFVALTLAYFKFRHQAPALISSAFAPLIGDRSKGAWGGAIDTLAVFATVFGIATSLGLGAKQIT